MEAFLEEFQDLKHFKLKDVKSITGDFHNKNVVGEGGFGKVYKGILSDSNGQNMAAFKRLSSNCGQGNPEFLKEIFMLSRYTHENLISLLGFCDEDGEKILVYEYAFHGSLDCHLSNPTLTWRQRLKICIGAARGLCYLHDPKDTHERVIHRDIKSSNILLDENWNAKVSDMGLSKIGPANQKHTFLVSNVVGTFWYVDPIYMETSILTKESDVYSFGVVLFEVLCGSLCFEDNNNEFQSLVRMWKRSYQQRELDQIIFQDPKGKLDPQSLLIFSNIAYQCLVKSRKERPKMSHVVEKLTIALQFQEKYEDMMKTQVQVGLDFEKLEHGCEHYRRRCKIRAPCCNKVFGCRHCHNKYTSELNDPKERHSIVQRDIQQVVCRVCNMEQPVAQICGYCGVKMGEYFCAICNLFDDDTSKQQFHCYDCGICRLFGRENYFHCDKCGGCYILALRGSHTCVENAMKKDCPVCHRYLFDSTELTQVGNCGHVIHVDCCQELLREKKANCPICSKAFHDCDVCHIESSEAMGVMKCGHVIHEDCYMELLGEKKANCPLCFMPLGLNEEDISSSH